MARHSLFHRCAFRRTAVGLLVLVLLVSRPATADSLDIDLLTDTGTVRMLGDLVFDRAGIAATSCDVNGDGLLDLIVGADQADGPGTGRNDSGEVYLILGRKGALPASTTLAAMRVAEFWGQESTDNTGDGLACGDLDNDGLDDMVFCAPWAQRNDTAPDRSEGLAHVVWGRTSYPPSTDLASTPDLTIWGGYTTGQLCTDPVIADIDGDGTKDLLLNDYDGPGPDGVTDWGRVSMLLGRSNWPNHIDLRLDGADLEIYGSADDDQFSDSLAVGDLDGDGRDDIIVGAHWGDGPSENRAGAGDIFIFRGRATWPTSLSRASNEYDSFVYGADAADHASVSRGLVVVDLDSDLKGELAVGLPQADSVSNLRANAGEVRINEFGGALPAQVDLRTRSDRTIWGARAGDDLGASIVVGDVNGDGTSDLVQGGAYADGPNASRSNAGEIYALFGGPAWPATRDLATDTNRWRIIGGNSNDRLQVIGLTDLNSDGVKEIVAASDTDSTTDLPAVWLISPLDTDGDGISQLHDNCPLVANSSQSDTNSDLVGDACQTDYDGDGVGDSSDCRFNQRTQGRPPEVLTVHASGGTVTTFTWAQLVSADRYDVQRGLVSELSQGSFGSCQNGRDPDRSDTTFVEPALPPLGSAFFFLFRGVDNGCGGKGSWGNRSDGVERGDGLPPC